MAGLQVQDVKAYLSPQEVFENMIQALNHHDLEAMVGWFAPDYRSEQPFYPERFFTGREGVRKNWSFLFNLVPDLQADILNAVVDGDTIWAEVYFHGRRADGQLHATRGVTLQCIQEDRITWARLYIITTPEPNIGGTV